MYKPQRVRDPLHNLIEFQADEFENTLWKVVQTPSFQRLRRVKQLGFSDLVYPGATHSRFAHSLGVFHTARMLMSIISKSLGPSSYKQTKAQAALAAALVHDLGHGAFSHAFEDVGKRLNALEEKDGRRSKWDLISDHEFASESLIKNGDVAEALKTLGGGFADDVADIIKNGGRDIYSAVVSSQFDADRLDYMRRDRLMTGTNHGVIDFDWLLANLEIGQVPYGVDKVKVGEIETFVLGPKAIYAAEAYVLGLFQLYPTVYFHKATRGAEKIFTELLFRVARLVMDGNSSKTGLREGHPIVSYISDPENIDKFLMLDDSIVWGSLPMMMKADDKIICELSKRLHERKLYKSINIRERIRQKKRLDNSKDSSAQIDADCAIIEKKLDEWKNNNPNDSHKILTDKTVRDPYKKFNESKGPLNQIRIRVETGKLVDLVERSNIVRAIQPFKLNRVYMADGDDKCSKFVENLIVPKGYKR